MSTPIVLVVLALVLAVLLFGFVPRLIMRKAQDRLATRLLAETAGGYQLLTRAEMVVGKYRRVPGVLGLTQETVSFQGLFGEEEHVPTSRILKIVTGRRLSSGRRLVRLEVLRLTRAAGGDLELVLAPDSAAAWRSHLGLWAVQERRAAMETVTPGRK